MKAIEYAQSQNWFPKFRKNFNVEFARESTDLFDIDDIESYATSVYGSEFINKAFLWSGSAEGYEFWENISIEFERMF